jgi:hypothetical protein
MPKWPLLPHPFYKRLSELLNEEKFDELPSGGV